MKRRVVNFRAIFFSAMALLLGILLARKTFLPNVFLMVFLFITVGVVVGFSIKYGFWKKAIVVIVSFCIGIGLFYAGLSFWRSGDVSKDVASVQGVIAEQISFKEGLATYNVDNLTVNGKSVRQNLKLRVSGTNIDFEVGAKVFFSSKLEVVDDFWLDNFNSNDYKRDVFYSAYVSSADISLEAGRKNFATRFQEKIQNLLNKNMTQENAKIAYAVLFGDKTGVDEDVNEDFVTVGTAHLLAISGLHVGFLVLLITWLLSVCRLGKKWHIVVVAPLLLFYCYLCSFTPSVSRASIMCVVLLLARTLGKENDNLTTMSIAMLIILLIRPLNAFNIGFQLSFACVFSMILLSKPISKLLFKIKIKGKLAMSISTILAVQIGIFPLIIKYMGQISFLTVIANLVCVPLFEIAFMCVLVAGLVSAILPFMSFIFWVPDFLFFTLIKVTNVFANVPNSTIMFSSASTWFAIYFYLGLFLLTRFMNLDWKRRTASMLVVVVGFLCFEIVDFSQNTIKKDSVLVMDIYGTAVYLVKDENGQDFLIDTDNVLWKYSNRIKSFLKKTKVTKLSSIYILGYEGANVRVQKFAREYACEKIISANGENPNYRIFTPIEIEKAMGFVCDGKKLVFVSQNMTSTEKNNLSYLLDEYQFDCCFQNSVYVPNVHSSVIFGGSNFSHLKENWTIDLKTANIESVRSIV